jgi:GTP:adenosylcobinamide-phosphate guanylyltransferase
MSIILDCMSAVVHEMQKKQNLTLIVVTRIARNVSETMIVLVVEVIRVSGFSYCKDVLTFNLLCKELL